MRNFFSFINSNFKWIAGLAIVIILFMWWKGCGNKSVDQPKDFKKQLDSLNLLLAESRKRAAASDKNVVLYKDSFYNAKGLIVVLSNDVSVTRRQMVELAKKVKQSRPDVPTTDYSQACDSLAELTDTLSRQLQCVRDQATAYSRYADSLQVALNKRIKELQIQVDACTGTLNYAATDVIPAVRRRLELYAGGSLIGSQQKPLSGIEATISLLTRRGQIWQVGSVWLGGQQYFKAGANFRLSFRKH